MKKEMIEKLKLCKIWADSSGWDFYKPYDNAKDEYEIWIAEDDREIEQTCFGGESTYHICLNLKVQENELIITPVVRSECYEDEFYGIRLDFEESFVNELVEMVNIAKKRAKQLQDFVDSYSSFDELLDQKTL